MKTTSWVVVEIATGEPVFETFNEKVIDVINTKKYRAVPIIAYLANLNKSLIKASK